MENNNNENINETNNNSENIENTKPENDINNIMLNRVLEIIDKSNYMFDIFEKQGDKDKIIAEIHEKTNRFADISKDEILYVADTLNNLVYATPMKDETFCIFSNEQNGFQKEMIFFSSINELEEYRSKNGNCPFLCLGFRDIITLITYFGLSYETVFLTDYVLNFSTENVESFYDFYIYENTNGGSNYIIGQPSESYNEAVELLNPKFNEFEELKNVWLYHIAEFKNKTQKIVGDKYELMYDVFVIECVEGKYIKIRDLINKITEQTNGHNVKVVLHNSDMGMLLINNKTDPIYSR